MGLNEEGTVEGSKFRLFTRTRELVREVPPGFVRNEAAVDNVRIIVSLVPTLEFVSFPTFVGRTVAVVVVLVTEWEGIITFPSSVVATTGIVGLLGTGIGTVDED